MNILFFYMAAYWWMAFAPQLPLPKEPNDGNDGNDDTARAARV